MRIGVAASGSYVSSSHDVEADQLEKDPFTLEPLPVQAAEHEVDLLLFDAQLRLSLGLGTRFAWEARIPFRVVGADATFLDASGAELEDFESIHHRDEVLAGIGDIEMGGRVRIVKPDEDEPSLVDVFAAMAFPTGEVEDNPYELGRAGRTHQHIFFGTGTLDPIVGLNASRSFGPVDLAVWSTVRTSLYDGSHGYRAGTKLTAGLGLSTGFGLEDWTFTVGPELYHEEPSTWDDGREAVNSGRTDLSPLLGVFWRASEGIQPYLVVKKPITLRTAGGQFDLPLVITLGADFDVGLFGAATEEDDHGHAHGHGHEHDDADDEPPQHLAEADVRDLAVGGASFSMADAVVEGKITVVDFWATWCHPCEHIDNLLRVLAAEHPELAVRRVEVIDDDSPVVRQHFDDEITLPIVWIYDREGKRVHTLSGTNEQAVKQALEPLLDDDH